jgi:hypothetical protein
LHVAYVAGDYSDAAVEEFAWAVRRTPAGDTLDRQMLSEGLANFDSRGLAALLKELACGHHGRRAREVSIGQTWSKLGQSLAVGGQTTRQLAVEAANQLAINFNAAAIVSLLRCHCPSTACSVKS